MRTMKILVACEESQAVTKELRRLGHEAYSCDVVECSGGHPEWHTQGDVLPLIHKDSTWIDGWYFCTMDGITHHVEKWDMIIAFPPCTDLAVSGARHFAQKQKDGRQQKSIAFFMEFANADCERIAIENPIGIMSSKWRKPDQIIQPWQFGHGETKATCLWLKNLPKLKPTKIVDGREQRIWRMPPSADRARQRSKTYEGIARAMAEQWTDNFQKERIGTPWRTFDETPAGVLITDRVTHWTPIDVPEPPRREEVDDFGYSFGTTSAEGAGADRAEDAAGE